MCLAIEYIDGGKGIEADDFRSIFSEGLVISTKYNPDGDTYSLPMTRNFVFETLRIEHIGMSTSPSGSSTPLDVWRSTSSTESMASLVATTRNCVEFGKMYELLHAYQYPVF